jgi:hypothetical protein
MAKSKSNSNPAPTSEAGLNRFLANYGDVSSEDLLRDRPSDKEVWLTGAGTWQSPAQSNS